MNKRELRAVAEAIHDAEHSVFLSQRDGHIQEAYKEVAQAAISASDSKYIKGLVEALKERRESDFHRLEKKYGECTKETLLKYSSAARAIQNLPEDLR